MAAESLNLEQLQLELTALNQECEEEWVVLGGKLNKTFIFRNFIDAFGFMTRAAIHAEKMNHHPEWSNVYRKVEVNLVTHEAGGITELDFKLARKMDFLATS